MGLTSAIVAATTVVAIKTKKDHDRRKRERKLGEEKEKQETLMLGIKRERDSLEKKQIEQEMLAHLEEQRQQQLFEARMIEELNKQILAEEERFRREEERLLEENYQRTVRDNENWINRRDYIISNFLQSVNYLSELSKYFESINVDYIYTKSVNLCISFIRNSDFYQKNIKIIFNKYLNEINKEVLEIKKQNYILIGKTGAGKSCLINYLLSLKGDKMAKEGETLDPETSIIQRYENESDNFTLTDTIGIEATNKERSLEKIEEMIKQHFEEKTKNIENNIHGIIYCIKSDSTRVEQKERDLIRRLMTIYPKKGIKLIIAITYHINKRNRRVFNLLKKEFGDSITIFEVNSKKELTDLGVIKESGRDNIIDFINTQSNDANSAVILNYKSKKIKEMYETNYTLNKLNLFNCVGNYTNASYLNTILSCLLPDENFISDFSNLVFVQDLNTFSSNIRNSFHSNFIKNLSNNLSYQLGLEKNLYINCTIQENYSSLAESKVENYFINTGFNEANSLVYIKFYQNLINPLFDIILEDLNNYKL